MPSIALIALALLQLPEGGTASSPPSREQVGGLLERHCVECHGPEEPADGLDLTLLLRDPAGLDAAMAVRLLAVLEGGEMPPRLAPTRPTPEEVELAVRWLSGSLATGPPRFPRARGTTMRRLNAREYRNALQDLLGYELPGEVALPGDGISQGFDTIGDTLSLPPVLLERYLEVAEEVAWRVVPPAPQPRRRWTAPELWAPELGESAAGVPVVLARELTAEVTLATGSGGPGRVRVWMGADQAGYELARARIRCGGVLLGEVEVVGRPERPDCFEFPCQLPGGAAIVEVAFVNDHYDPEFPDPFWRDRNLHVHAVELELAAPGPPPPSEFEERWGVRRRPAEEVLLELASLLWRGRAREADVAELLRLDPEAGSDRERVRIALVALLVSPRFLFRMEPQAAEAPRELDGPELVTRLAAWLWSSVPDEELLSRWPTGTAPAEHDLRSEVRRMLADPRSGRFARSFARQWLQLDRLRARVDGRAEGPGLDADLVESMLAEAEGFFDLVLREELPLSTLVDADFTVLDGILAEHYGLHALGVPEGGPSRVALPAEASSRRGGILGQAAVLTATSFPDRTSPVLRGKWVLEALLDEPPPPPPPDAGSLAPGAPGDAPRALRERLEEHRRDPACASCHLAMDGLGFALERYDALGGWRELEAGAPVDDRAELPDGTRLEGAGALARWLLEGDGLRRGLLRRMATYALGRPLSPADELVVAELLRQLPHDPTLVRMVEAIALSELLRLRSPDGGAR